ncbi:hypothetical protein [Nostoc sphaeroides]|uniref:Uncharacterized protein n=1 Tax=Nostoc sphaeroides CCNUC1 TaxID=2653204 RepID=A0A5P8WL43_9NOSO|nr:hypothetical protein [Nostoc sphaeroides]QFS52886.1 hypothetical protein GXM_10150 [Nostoc sphaeroides CCNUC1]
MNEFPIQDLDVVTSKSKLAVNMKCSLRSIHNYHEIAVGYVDDFLEDYPTMHGQFLTSCPLTIYQCWVLYRIYQFLKLIPKAEVLKHSLENDQKTQHQYSKTHFKAIYPEFKEEELNNDSKAICRLA